MSSAMGMSDGCGWPVHSVDPWRIRFRGMAATASAGCVLWVRSGSVVSVLFGGYT